jgi:hypothetical protein
MIFYHESSPPMTTTTLPTLTSMQKPISTDPAVFGTLQDCTALLQDPVALRQHMDTQGYIYLKGVLDTSKIAAARHIMAERLAAQGHIDTSYPIDECIATPATNVTFMPDLRQR